MRAGGNSSKSRLRAQPSNQFSRSNHAEYGAAAIALRTNCSASVKGGLETIPTAPSNGQPSGGGSFRKSATGKPKLGSISRATTSYPAFRSGSTNPVPSPQQGS